MNERANSVTSRDVAELAGVSQSTVSYVMSGRRGISEETRQRVRAAMKELGYQPHAGARALRGSRTNVIALVVRLGENVDAADTMPYIDTIIEEARGHDNDVVLVTTDEGPAGLTRLAARSICDGFVLMDIRANDDRIETAAGLRLPVVMIGRADDLGGLDAVDFDARRAGEVLARDLISSGHRHIVVVGEPPSVSSTRFRFVEDFQEGARSAASLADVDLQVVDLPRAGWEGISAAAPVLLANRADGLGLITRTPQATEWLYQLLRAEGLRPGWDVSVGGLLTDAVASRFVPPVTNISAEPRTVSRQAVKILFERLGGSEAPAGLKLIEPRPLTRRGTTAIFT